MPSRDESLPNGVPQMFGDDQIHRLSDSSELCVAEKLRGAFVPGWDYAVGVDDDHSVRVHVGIQPKAVP
jgi:hypothetical protein